MKLKKKVVLCQINNIYGENAFFPYSIGLIKAYCLRIKEISENYDFPSLFFLPEKNPYRIIEQMNNPDILGLSCYIWNWEYTKKIAEFTKNKYPSCFIIAGGPMVPDNSDGFFEQFPYFDLLIHGEGEITFSKILIELLHIPSDLMNIPNLSLHEIHNQTKRTTIISDCSDLSSIPSPYLEGVFDDFLQLPYSFHGLQETNRGCPYLCSFCEWGSVQHKKVRQFNTEKIISEYEWFGKNKIEMIYNCDANFGLFPRDVDLIKQLIKIHDIFHYPQKFRSAYAKNSGKRIIEIANLLNSANMSKGISLSFQSLNKKTLTAINRQNLEINQFSSLIQIYHSLGIPTYTELIMGLPEETYDSFILGVDTLLNNGTHESLNIYPCIALPNSHLGQIDYQKKYGIKTVRIPAFFAHMKQSDKSILEYYNIIYETSSMSQSDWKKSYIFSWAIQCFHCFGLTQYMAIFFHYIHNIPYTLFYESFIKFCSRDTNSIVGKELAKISQILDNVISGGSFDYYVYDCDDIIWPTEEGSFLSIILEKDTFNLELNSFIHSFILNNELSIDDTILQDLFNYQSNIITSYKNTEAHQLKLHYNLYDFFSNIYNGNVIKIEKKEQILQTKFQEDNYTNFLQYAINVVWYGRKNGRFRNTFIPIE